MRVLRFTQARFMQWMHSFAKRADLSVTEVRWRIDELGRASFCHDEYLGRQHLESATLGDSVHVKSFAKCWRCHAIAVLFRLFYAGMHERITVVGKRRERALYAAMCRLEGLLAGKAETDDVRESEPKRKSPPYANVGVYNPKEVEEEDGGEESMLTRRVTLLELLKFPLLSDARQFGITEHAGDRAVIHALKNTALVFGLLRPWRAAKNARRTRRNSARARYDI